MIDRALKVFLDGKQLEADVAQKKIDALRPKLAALESRLARIKDEYQAASNDHRPFGKYTWKNKDVYSAWAAVERQLFDAHPIDGAPPRVLFQTMQEEIDRLNPTTFRSYLRRFREKGLIEKHSGNWRLQVDRRRDQLMESVLVASRLSLATTKKERS